MCVCDPVVVLHQTSSEDTSVRARCLFKFQNTAYIQKHIERFKNYLHLYFWGDDLPVLKNGIGSSSECSFLKIAICKVKKNH